ncbi:uncharacterized protein LOC126265293 [Aethina tumida]|uniref:uncharacterized protein LOC126265293 n=1 Tax=Aethina tumida TaxID=116153 RepID=UPI0021498B1F|nr:uncharacterized protein LOC126265293 [Aethina tumida]
MTVCFRVSWTLVFIIFLGIILVENGLALKCYVCGDPDRSCNGFDPSNPKYIEDCSENDKSCFRIMDGNVTKRSCDPNKINDCQKANQVEYCYCSKDLCNGDQLLETTDDEDILEGSGSNKLSKEIVATTTVTTVTQKTSRASIKNVNGYFVVFIGITSIIEVLFM